MPTKKTTKKVIAKKTAVKSAPVAEHKCMCGENCNCHCHGSAHWVKHVIAWAIIFALGMVCGKMMNCNHGPEHMPKMNPVFENGCLKMDSIDCPMMREKLMTADVDGNECISVEEYKAVKKEMKKDMRGPKGHRGSYMPKMGR